MRVTFHPDARGQLSVAVLYYEEKEPGLGAEFLWAVAASVEHIRQYPESCPYIVAGYRRTVVHRFPYAVVYRVCINNLQVVSVMHNRRGPDYLRGRLK